MDEIGPAPAGAGTQVSASVAGHAVALCLELDIEGCGRVVLPAAAGRLPPLARGLYPIRGARLVSTWPLGLLSARKPVRAPREIVVYPEPGKLPEGRGVRGALAELCGWGAAGGFLQPSSLRESRDSLRRFWPVGVRPGRTAGEGRGSSLSISTIAKPTHWVGECEPHGEAMFVSTRYCADSLASA